MNDWVAVQKKQVNIFFGEYGKVAIVFVSICMCTFSLISIVSFSIHEKLRISFLDVGQGDAIFIQTPNGHDMLIDGGPTKSVLEELHKQMSYFDRDIDVVIATHGDADHVTGLIPVLETYNVRHIIHSPIPGESVIFEDLESHVTEEGSEVHVGKRGDVIDFGDGVIVRVLHPNRNIPLKTETNDASISVVVTYGEHSFLLTGDLSSKYESQLLQSALPKNITVFKAGHHGSNTSSGVPLLSYIKPEYAVISAGTDNRYGHPNVEAVERLQTYSKEILSTIDDGTITFISDGRMIDIKKEK